MKSLITYIKEQISDKEELNTKDSIDYSAFTEILLYIKTNDIFHDRIKAIIKKYREDFNDSLSASSLKTTKIFNKFIDDAIEEYNKDYNHEEQQITLNIGTKTHLKNEVAAWMIVKIRTELEKIDLINVGED